MEHLEHRDSMIMKLIYHPIFRIILGMVIVVSATGLIKSYITKPFFSSIIQSETLIKVFVTLLGTLVMTLTYYFFTKYYEKREVTELSFKSSFLELFGGFSLGLGVIALEFLLLFCIGNYKILDFEGFDLLTAPFTFLIGAAMLEELVFRGILYRILEQWKGTTVALIVSGVLFELPHLLNPNVAVIGSIGGIVFGLLMGIMFTYTKRIWLPFSFHLGWNLAQPIFGSNLTGLDQFGVLFKAEFSGSEIVTGSAMGIEDSIFSLITLIVLFIVFYLKSKKKKHLVSYRNVEGKVLED